MKRIHTSCLKFAPMVISASMLSITPAIAQRAVQANKGDHKEAIRSDAATDLPSFSVKIVGHGTPMILIPGLSSSGETWNGTVAHFQDRYTCYVLTLAGFAGEAPIRRPLLATVREDLAAYVEKRHLHKPVVVGHSLGGNIALDLAAHHADLVGPLVVVDSLPFPAGAWFHVKTVEEARPMIAGMKGYMDTQTREQYEQFVRSGAATKYMVTNPADLQKLVQWGLGSDPKTVSEAMIELVSQDLRRDLSKIGTPTLVLGSWSGLKEQLRQNGIELTREGVTKTFQEQYADLPHLQFALADTARHFIMWDDPSWFFDQLDGFLGSQLQATQSR